MFYAIRFILHRVRHVENEESILLRSTTFTSLIEDESYGTIF